MFPGGLTSRASSLGWLGCAQTAGLVRRPLFEAQTVTELRRLISRPRSGGGRAGSVTFLYTPGHRGIAPNAMADAVAKAYLGGEVDHAVVHHMLRHAWHVRPYLYGQAVGGRWQAGSMPTSPRILWYLSPSFPETRDATSDAARILL